MFVVGIAELAGTVDEEAQALASNLGSTPYETRMLLLPGLPAIVLISPDKARALELLANLRQRGHHALAFDASAVVSSSAMQLMRRFRLEDDAIVAEKPDEGRLAYDDVLVMLRATHDTRFEQTTEHSERKFSAGRAMLTGGLVVTKKESSTSVARSQERHEVLYLFRRSGQTPWLLPDSGPHYTWLGDRMASTERANFLTVVDMLRERTPGATYDDRLVGRKVPERMCQAAIGGQSRDRTFATSSAAGMDMVAHLLAMWIAKRARSNG